MARRGQKFTEAAQKAAIAARKAKAAIPKQFGLPELFVVKAGDQVFTWELRRFGGVLLESVSGHRNRWGYGATA